MINYIFCNLSVLNIIKNTFYILLNIIQYSKYNLYNIFIYNIKFFELIIITFFLIYNCNVVATWSDHVISLVIIQQYFTKSTFTYYFILTNFYYQPSSKLQLQFLLTNLSLFGFRIGIWTSSQVLQLAKPTDQDQPRAVACNWEKQTPLSMYSAET